MNHPDFVITKQTNQLFDLRKDRVMQIDEFEATVTFLQKSTFETVYDEEEKIIITPRRFFAALLKVQNEQLGAFTNLFPDKTGIFKPKAIKGEN